MLEHQFTEMKRLHCPYCGEAIELIIEFLDEPQNYIEDCEVCCQPMTVVISADGQVEVLRAQDSYF